jgi:hypothetical protein
MSGSVETKDDNELIEGNSVVIKYRAAAPSAPPTAAPPASVEGSGVASDAILRAPPVMINIQTAPIRAKITMLCISIFALDIDYLKIPRPRLL